MSCKPHGGTPDLLVPCGKLCTYTQGERDDIMTAKGPIHLTSHTFQATLFWQVEALEFAHLCELP